jgi:LysM repeat protein
LQVRRDKWTKGQNGKKLSIFRKFAPGFMVAALAGVMALAGVTGAHAAGGQAYTVVSGDTLSSIAARFGTDVSSIAAANGIADVNVIYAGQSLTIPTGGATQTTNVPSESKALPSQPTTSAAGGSIVDMIHQVFGPYGDQAVRVATCESSLNPNAYNPSGATGLFQIMPATWAGTSQAGNSLTDPWANINAAHEIFQRDGNSWVEWVCQP